MIPRILHYCWFGRNPKPKLAERCIKSWKKYCPDFEILEWNEDNFDLSAAPTYVRQAYEAKKWAFVSDYVRLKALTEMGGVYLDTDVELVKPLEPFLKHRAFVGFEAPASVSTGVMACEKDFPLFRECLGHYDDLSFQNPDGTLNVTTNVETVTGLLKDRGLVPNGEAQEVEGLLVYPSDVFSPVSFETGRLKRTRKTTAIHWFSGSWYTEQERSHRKALQRKARWEKMDRLGKRMARKLLGEEGCQRWAERWHRYKSWEEIRKIPRRAVRKLLGKSNAEE